MPFSSDTTTTTASVSSLKPMAARWRVPSDLFKSVPLRQRKNARRVGDAVALHDDAAVVDRVVREENGLEHFRRRVAIHLDAGLDGLLQLDGLLDGDERADFHIREPLDGLDDDLDAFALFARAGEERQVAQLAEHPAQFRLENHHRADGDEHAKRCRESSAAPSNPAAS